MSLLLLFNGGTEAPLTATLSGEGSLEVVFEDFPLTATLSGSGSLDVIIADTFAATLSGSGSLDVIIAEQLALRVSLVGRGWLSAAVPPSFSPEPGAPDLPARGRRRRFIPVRQDGTPYVGEITEAEVTEVTWELNTPDTYGAVVPAGSAKSAAVWAERLREAQVWLGDSLLTWGPMSQPTQDESGALGINGKGVDWYYQRRNVGKADRTNYVANGSFEDGLAGWSPETNTYNHYWDLPEKAPKPVATIVSNPHITGSRAVKLVQEAIAGQDSWLSQTFEWIVDPNVNPDGDEFTFRAYCWLEDGWFLGPANEERGIFIARYSTTELDPDPKIQEANPGHPKLLEVSIQTLDEDTPTNTWNRLEATLTVPPSSEPEHVQVRLYAVQGTVVWDEAALTLNETERYRSIDQAEIVQGLAEHLADPAYDKTAINVGFDCPATGVLRNRDYVHSDHPNGWSSMTEFVNLRDGLDLSMVYGPTTRTLRTHFPFQGRWRPSARLSFGQNFGVYSFASDGEAAATAVVTLGEGSSGSDREEGFASDVSGYAEGIVIEEVFSPGPDTPIDALDDRAAERLAITREPDVLDVTTFPATPLLGRVGKGDWVPVDLHHEGLHLSSVVYRIVRMTLNPDDSLSFTLNRRDVGVA